VDCYRAVLCTDVASRALMHDAREAVRQLVDEGMAKNTTTTTLKDEKIQPK